MEKKASSSELSSLSSSVNAVEQTANANKKNVSTLSEKVVEVEGKLSELENGNTGKTYDATYEDSTYTLWEIENEGDDQKEVRTAKSQFKIVGGSGGGTTTTSYYRRPVKALLAYIQSKLHKVATSGSYNDLSNKPTTFPPSEHNHDDSYLKLTGGTLTGPLNIKGNAASNPLMIRGIVGSDGNGTVAELYLQYGANSALKLGNGGAHSISADGGTYSGKSASATKATQDSAGQQINTTYLKGLSISGKTITSTKGNGSTSTITLPTATNSADGDWYYFSSTGAAYQSQWVQNSDGKFYYFGADGKMVKNAWIKSTVLKKYYWVNENGEYIEERDTENPDGKVVI